MPLSSYFLHVTSLLSSPSFCTFILTFSLPPPTSKQKVHLNSILHMPHMHVHLCVSPPSSFLLCLLSACQSPTSRIQLPLEYSWRNTALACTDAWGNMHMVAALHASYMTCVTTIVYTVCECTLFTVIVHTGWVDSAGHSICLWTC